MDYNSSNNENNNSNNSSNNNTSDNKNIVSLSPRAKRHAAGGYVF